MTSVLVTTIAVVFSATSLAQESRDQDAVLLIGGDLGGAGSDPEYVLVVLGGVMSVLEQAALHGLPSRQWKEGQ